MKYGLLIQNILYHNKALTYQSNTLLHDISNEIEKKYSVHNKKFSTNWEKSDQIVRLKWFYAYCNYIIAKDLEKQIKTKEAEPYFLLAANLSPDMNDYNFKGGFFYDMIFLLKAEHDSFVPDYISFLQKNNSDFKRIQNAYLIMALKNPSNKPELKKFYNTHNDTTKLSFDKYWQNQSNENLTIAPDIDVSILDGKKFNLIENRGKWILLDFWGTWCGPCRAEHPDLQKFYTEISKSSKIQIMTIACRDQEEKVKNYIKENRYSFPVAMKQQQPNITNSYNVAGYPTKVLINPEGKYLTIPFGLDWVDFIKKYVEL